MVSENKEESIKSGELNANPAYLLAQNEENYA